MYYDQVYHGSTRINTNHHKSTQINTSTTRINTSQHESDTNQHESDTNVDSCNSQACNFIKKETLAQVFSCEFCEISKNTFLQNTSARLLLSNGLKAATKNRKLFKLSCENPKIQHKSWGERLSRFKELQQNQKVAAWPTKDIACMAYYFQQAMVADSNFTGNSTGRRHPTSLRGSPVTF